MILLYVGPIPCCVVPIFIFFSFILSINIWKSNTIWALSLINILSLTLIFALFWISFISFNKLGIWITTPLPITHLIFSFKIPDGITWNLYLLLSTITVCPALQPPETLATIL